MRRRRRLSTACYTICMNYSALLSSLKQTFINQDDYFFDKHVSEFIKDGTFFADYFSQLAVEPLEGKAPRFYHTFSPFDVVSNKSPHRAVVFEAGETLLNIDFNPYVAMRTAAMSAVVLKGIGLDDLKDKNVLLFGAGRIATQSVAVLSSQLGLKNIDVITTGGDLSGLQSAASGVAIRSGAIEDIGKYDIIICHTSAAEPILKKEQLAAIKPGALLASFISSSEHGEFPDEIYNSQHANIITDWQKTLLGAKDLKRAMDADLFSEGDLIYIKDLLSGRAINNKKQYTVYRSTGTPIQNLAVLRLLVQE